jgi:hypothetical protein
MVGVVRGVFGAEVLLPLVPEPLPLPWFPCWAEAHGRRSDNATTGNILERRNGFMDHLHFKANQISRYVYLVISKILYFTSRSKYW